MVSVPFFGFFSPCRRSRLGGHRHIEKVEEKEAYIATLLRTAYNCVPWFDRAKFNEFASPETKALLSA